MKYKFIEANIDDLQLDLFNARLPPWIQGKSEKDIIEWMLSDANFFDLITSIGKYDYYPGEPLLVIENPQGKYIVIAGNRRLACCKILNNPGLANVKHKRINNRVGETKMEYAPQIIPAFVFDKREDILVDLYYTPGPKWMRGS
ncbi:MAG: ParB N-terminal domain-containing protein [Ginsengibacter sp.]